MRCLLDTCLFLDWISDDYISPDIQAIIADYDNTLYLSSESIKEYVNLFQQGKLRLPSDMQEKGFDVFDLIENTLGITVKYVTKEHLQKMMTLPNVEGHTDPSDRLIIAQALAENLTLLSSDGQFPNYKKLHLGLDLIENKRPSKKY